MGFADSRDDGNSAQRVPVGCREAELRGDFLSRRSDFSSRVTRSRAQLCREQADDGVSVLGLVAMGWESQPRKICGRGIDRRSDQIQSGPAHRWLVSRLQPKFFLQL